ncbi:unnamed protein product [Closterium sp. Naga37s-1]|nr:unnamed protein product [Closterium sp. Naga37s-1]
MYGLPWSLSLVSPGPSLPSLRGLPLPAIPVSRGGKRAAPHSSKFPPTEASAAGLFTWTCGARPASVARVDAVEPVEVAVDSGAARGAEPAGA